MRHAVALPFSWHVRGWQPSSSYLTGSSWKISSPGSPRPPCHPRGAGRATQQGGRVFHAAKHTVSQGREAPSRMRLKLCFRPVPSAGSPLAHNLAILVPEGGTWFLSSRLAATQPKDDLISVPSSPPLVWRRSQPCRMGRPAALASCGEANMHGCCVWVQTRGWRDVAGRGCRCGCGCGRGVAWRGQRSAGAHHGCYTPTPPPTLPGTQRMLSVSFTETKKKLCVTDS